MSGGEVLAVQDCRGWADNGQQADLPKSVRAQCTYCGDWCAFILSGTQFNVHSRIATARSVCAGCDGKPTFVFVYDDSKNALASKKPSSIVMFPANDKTYSSPENNTAIPDAVWRSMEATVNAYNSRNYSAAMTTGRRTLEGVFKYMVAEEHQRLNLVKLIAKASETVDLTEPLTRLSNAIREGGNLGAHFDMEKEPDDLMARQLVELLSYLIEYLYVLPSQIEALEKAIEAPT